ncbi:MAG: hypothetical protein P8080_02480 [Gammaproteobacteria bacterium]
MASIVAGAPGCIVLNRVIGLGLASPATGADLEDILDQYERARAGRFFLHLHPEARPPDLQDRLEAAGFVSARAWRKFRRPAGPVDKRASSLQIREVGPEHAGAFGRIAAAGFDLPPRAAPLVAGLVGRPGWHMVMSFDGDEPAGTGALFIQEGIAWTDWAATRPEYRRRGGQAAVLARRLEIAMEAGCEWVVTCTGEAVPGDPQHSYGNILKAGFEEWTLRPNYAPAPT